MKNNKQNSQSNNQLKFDFNTPVSVQKNQLSIKKNESRVIHFEPNKKKYDVDLINHIIYREKSF